MLRAGLGRRSCRCGGGLWSSPCPAAAGGSAWPRCPRALSAASASPGSGGGARGGGAPPAGSRAAPSSASPSLRRLVGSLFPLPPSGALRRCRGSGSGRARSLLAGGGRPVKHRREASAAASQRCGPPRGLLRGERGRPVPQLSADPAASPAVPRHRGALGGWLGGWVGGRLLGSVPGCGVLPSVTAAGLCAAAGLGAAGVAGSGAAPANGGGCAWEGSAVNVPRPIS